MTPPEFEHTFTVLWGDIDANRHMRNTAYSDYASHTRFAWLAEHGFTLDRLDELAIGPVLFKEATEYNREFRLHDRLLINMRLAGWAPDGYRWRVTHELYRLEAEGKRVRAATITMEGAWFNLRTHKLALPPAEMVAVFESLTRTADFQALPPRRKAAHKSPPPAPPG